MEPFLSYIDTTYPGEFYLAEYNATTFPSYEAYYVPSNGPNDAGNELLIGSRLLPAEALTANMTALKIALQGFIPPLSLAEAYLVVGQGVKNAVPRGGSDAVNPAWRNAIIRSSECSPIPSALPFARAFLYASSYKFLLEKSWLILKLTICSKRCKLA